MTYTALAGPIIGGQIVSAVGVLRGWTAICVLSAGLTALVLPPIVIFVGGPLRWRPWRASSAAVTEAETAERKVPEEYGPEEI